MPGRGGAAPPARALGFKIWGKISRLDRGLSCCMG